ncbi:YqaA family protein [Lysobacter soyae]|jgi:membrane protein YqaA with SNARE-associated domain|uniref:DedA family protein n=1 Tax=Lysobacter soyae TaxID=2764185 RepID=A0ABX8WL56_9GAMM|nr:YqaA family protein [Lysobacter sp. CJ11]QYR52360.1 DedA family protein [Lysobacter sp. CJ11]
MKIFKPIYEKALRWAQHKNATWILAGLSFIEAIFFPVMPEVMLAPMALARPKRAFFYAFVSLAGSMLGAVVGYWLGQHAWELVKPLFAAMHMLDKIEGGIQTIQAKMVESPWAVFWFLVAGGFMPIPMKVFTWASGIVGVPWLQYLAAMAVGRAKRVLLLALAIRLGGERAERLLHKWIEPVGWFVVVLVLIVIGYLFLRN